jgi:undecaprenyl diphosphate synthase
MTDKKENLKMPSHIGIIMDGNRRWARERNLPTMEGHSRGYEKFRQVPEWFFALGVKMVSFYVFSTENWQRSQDEVNYLMKLIGHGLTANLDEMDTKGYKIVFSGKIDELPGDLPEVCQNVTAKTANNVKGIVNICLNYGGRPEIIDAMRKMVMNKLEPEQIHEGMLRKYLYQPDLPDPDVIVRTAGERRLSNFLLWQSAYSELIFLEKYWPDFERGDAEKIIAEFNQRDRRFGSDSETIKSA